MPDKKHAHMRLMIAGTIGFFIALLETIRIWLPTVSLVGQFAQFSLIERSILILQLLSPILSFLLTGGWVWALLWFGEQWLLAPETSKKIHAPLIQETIQQQDIQPETAQSYHDHRHDRQKKIAVPPLFQLDPTHPPSSLLSFTPYTMAIPDMPSSNHPQNTPMDTTEPPEKEQTANDTELAEPSKERTTAPNGEKQQKAGVLEKQQPSFSLLKASEQTDTPVPVTLTLLKQVQCWLRADDGTTKEVKLHEGENAIRLIQLAYMAWRQGTPVSRDKMLTYVIGRGKRRDMNADQLGEVFDAAKRYLRQDLNRAKKALEEEGHPVTAKIDFFQSDPGFYSLPTSCHVTDLALIDDYDRTIQTARKEGILDEKRDGTLPDWVIAACNNLMDAYTGDFLQTLLEKFPDEFGSWVKEPVTHYRDCYLEALSILANYESALGRTFFDEAYTAEQNEEQRRHHSSRAAQLFYEYAMYAINSRWDKKLKFAYRAEKDGERVVRSARAIRRCVVELGKLGNPDMIDHIYLAFKERMSLLSDGNWEPDPDTENDVTDAKRTTSEYRFASQMPSRQERE